MQENVGDQWLRNSGSSTYPGEYDAICDAPLAKRNPACDQPIASGNPTGTAAVRAVKMAHHIVPKARIQRGPNRSASRPPGAWKSAYPQLNALATIPNLTWSNPKARSIEVPATPMFTRSRKAMALITNIQKISNQRTRLGRGLIGGARQAL